MILECYTRVFVDDGALDATSAFYQKLLAGRETLRFADTATGLELAAVSATKMSVLIIAGSPARRAPFEATKLTIKVDVLDAVVAELRDTAEQLEPVQSTPVGRKTRFRHPDGLVVEYVDHA